MCALELCLAGAAAAQESSPASAPSQQTQSRPVHISGNVTRALTVKIVLPRYPQEALTQHIEGDVLIKIVVTEDGIVDDAVLIFGHPPLGTAAIGAVKLWKFQPFLLNGRPVKIETEAALRFEINSSDGAGRVFIGDTPASSASGIVGDAPGGFPADQSTASTPGITSSAPVQVPGTGSSGRVRVSQKVAALLLAKKVAPAYPPEALNGRIQGTVLLHVVVNKAGDVDTVELISGHPLLAPAAIDAVKQWKYKPYLLQGKPVEMETQIQVNFVLPGNHAATLG